ncbi:MAG: hypothetical protein B1H40_04160 [Candidatus Latescibacteria bacterium 4484_181]|nr:MAG: hypothetical protein B1H40_04160 [Candidatus Latescibacteria bacterium 4484_181]RKY72394.1 MAG: hypothetical protein DRQ24_05160 [Candidatus Latescibacterota bacterium]
MFVVSLVRNTNSSAISGGAFLFSPPIRVFHQLGKKGEREGKNFCHPGKNSKGAEIQVRRLGESNTRFSLALIGQTKVHFQTNCQWHGNCRTYFSVDETAFTSPCLASVGLKLRIMHSVI